MRAIVRSAALFFAVAGLAVVSAADDPHDDVMEVLSKMAAALTGASGGINERISSARSGNVAEFMSAVSKDMPEYETLKSNVTALVRDAEISSSITPVTEEPKGETYDIDLDWLLQIRNLEQDGPMVRRREVVHCELRKEKKHWKVVSLKPLDFFAATKSGE